MAGEGSPSLVEDYDFPWCRMRGAGCAVHGARSETKWSGDSASAERMEGAWFLIPPLKGARGMFLHVA